MLDILKRSGSRASKTRTFDRFVRLLESMDTRQPGLLRVLTYHRVDDRARRPWLDPSMISASPQDFKEQMAYLASHYETMTTDEVLGAFQCQNYRKIPARAVLVTFDDGYSDFEEQAWPVLQRYNIPVALFVPTAYPDRPEYIFWWDDLYHALHRTDRNDALETPLGRFSLSDTTSRRRAHRRLKRYIKTLPHEKAIQTVRELCDELGVQPAANSVLRWNSLRRLSREGVTIGAHTQTHALLNRISLEEAREEILGSLADLRREIGSVPPIFAYPSGEFNRDVVRLLEGEEVGLAFTTKRGVNNISRAHPLKIRRINVGGRTSLPLLRTQLLVWSVRFRRLQNHLDV